MFKRYQSLGQVYQLFQKSDFSASTFLALWQEKFFDAMCVYQSLKLEQMEKIYKELQEMLRNTSRFYFFRRSKLKDCILDISSRYTCKRGKQNDKVWKKKQMMGLLHPTQTNLVIITFDNGEKILTNPHLVERKYSRIVKNQIQLSSSSTEVNLNDTELDRNDTELDQLINQK